ncbi:hypothetical protein [Variovorax sp. AFSI2.2]|uniref:hypothetical protein n=1 Tax=Variovorax sp. AFSI2.2 TaxID=3384160 RepID=UPI003EBFE9EA
MALLAELFKQHTAYQFELTKQLQATGLDGKPLTDKYAIEILNFSGELGIIQKLPGASNAPHLSRLALTDSGIAIKAASNEDLRLANIVLEHLILEADADAYLTVLQILKQDLKKTSEEQAEEFRQKILAMRAVRLEWLATAFPNKSVLTRLIKGGAHQVHWVKIDRLGRLDFEKPSADFGRHHFSPRKTWAVELGHYDADNAKLTAMGEKFLTQSGYPSDSSGWIGPDPQCVEFLRPQSPLVLKGASGSTLELLRPQSAQIAPHRDFLEKVADFLEHSFPKIKLFHAKQASVAAAMYFTILCEIEHGYRVSFEEVLRSIAVLRPGRFAFFASRTGALAYYQLRNNVKD